MKFVRGMRYLRCVDAGGGFVGLSNAIDSNWMGYIVEKGLLKELEDFLHEGGLNEALEASLNGDYQNARILLKRKGQGLPVDETGSSGTVALMLLFYWMKRLGGASFVFVDDFDAFYHPELAEFVYRKFKALGRGDRIQCVLTTHRSRFLSNRMNRPDCCYVVTPEGISSLLGLTTREIRKGNNVEQLYLSNAFGAM